MTSLYKKLNEKYQNADDLIGILKEFRLDSLIDNTIKYIETKIENEKISDLPKLSGIILNDINSILAKIEDLEKKRKIEYLLSDIFQDYLNEINKHKNAKNTISEISLNIKSACEYRGYNYEKLNSFLNIDKLSFLLPKSNVRVLYYEWLGRLEELDEIAKDLYDKKIIYSVKEFKKIFTENEESKTVRFNKNKLDEIIIFFQVLKELKLIKPKGNSGHFAPFVQYAVDNEGLFLVPKSINKEHERIKSNSVKYLEIKEYWRGLINSNKIHKKG